MLPNPRSAHSCLGAASLSPSPGHKAQGPLVSDTPSPRELPRGPHVEGGPVTAVHTDDPPLARRTPDLPGGLGRKHPRRACPRGDRYLAAVAPFTDFEESEEFFLLLIRLVVAKGCFSKGFWGQKAPSYFSAREIKPFRLTSQKLYSLLLNF